MKNHFKLLAIYIVCLVLIGQAYANQSFDDVSEEMLFYDPIMKIVDEGIAEGYTEDTFEPEKYVTRGQMARFIANWQGLDTANPPDQPTFKDVDELNLFYGDVEAVVAAGIAKGYPDDSFGLNDKVTRGQMARFIASAMGLDTANPPDQPTFKDVDEFNLFFGDIEAIVKAGIASGYGDGNFGINDNIKREQMAGMLYNALDYTAPSSPFVKVTGHFPASPEPLDSQGNAAVGDVVLIYPNRYKTVEVVDNSFEFEIERDGPVGVSFVDKAGNYLGYLNLGDGIIGIPGQAVAQEIAALDLGEVTGDDGSFSPENNPIGNEIDIAEQDLESMAVAGTFFSAVAMNPDFVESMTKDDQFIYIYNLYDARFAEEKHFDRSGNIIEDLNLNIREHVLHFKFNPPYANFGNLRLTYPSELDLWVQDNTNFDDMTGDFIFLPPVGYDHPDLIIPEAGEYRLYDPAAGGLDVSFELPDLKDATEKNLVVPKPQVHLDEDETMVEGISWEFYTREGSRIDNPENIMSTICLKIGARFDESDKLIGDYEEMRGHLVFEEYNLEIEADNYYDLTDYKIYWDDIWIIHLDYYDVYDMVYMVHYAYRDLDSEVYSLEVEAEPQEGGTVTPRFGYYAKGEEVEVSAEPAEGWEFEQWISEVIDSFDDKNATTTTFAMPNENATTTAVFVEVE